MSGTVWPTTFVYDDATFRLQFPKYADPNAYPEAMLQLYFDNATNFVSADNIGLLVDGQRRYAIFLMMGHLLQLMDNATSSGSDAAPGLQSLSRIRDVMIKWEVPTFTTEWAWWLNQTGAGQTLLALLRTLATGGGYLAGPRGPFNGGCGPLGLR